MLRNNNIEGIINSLLEQPSEGLNREYKQWFDPQSNEGKSKIAKTLMALRNFNGGYMVIGFSDDMKPVKYDFANSIFDTFSKDSIQGVVSNYSSEPFEIDVYVRNWLNNDFVIIVVPSGVRVPVVCKRDLKTDKGMLLKENQVYVRTLRSNDTPSSSTMTWKDLPDLLEVCFENREADVGRFIRRQLGGVNLKDFASILASNHLEGFENVDEAKKYIDSYEEHKTQKIIDSGSDIDGIGFWGCLLTSDHKLTHESPTEFLSILKYANPSLSGWPIWLVSSAFSEDIDRPKIIDGEWYQFINYLEKSEEFYRGLDYMRYSTQGRFYFSRTYQDDFANERYKVQRGTCLDLSLMIYRVSETLIVGLNFAKALDKELDSNNLYFNFHWNGLKGRKAVSWTSIGFLFGRQACEVNEVKAFVSIPANTAVSAIAGYVLDAMKDLALSFAIELELSIVEPLVSKLLKH